MTAFLTGVAVLGALIGVPMPRMAPDDPGSDEDFPCRHHRCGCRSAEMCRQACCCQKPATPKKTCCERTTKETRRPPAGLAVIKALQCRGVSLWQLAAAPIVCVDVASRVPVESRGPAEMWRELPTVDPASRTLTVNPPPPRAA